MSRLIKLPQQEMSIEALEALLAEAKWPVFQVGDHATPEEIAAATLITPKVGMLLKRKSDGAAYAVWAFWRGGFTLNRVDQQGECRTDYGTSDLSTEDYTILDSYTIQGAK